MTEHGIFLALQLRDNALSQRFAEFDAPLIEGIGLSYRFLSENGVLVKGDEFVECFRRKPFREDHVERPVALKYPVGCEPVLRALGLPFYIRCVHERIFVNRTSQRLRSLR